MFTFGQESGIVLGVIHSHSRERNKWDVDGNRELMDRKRGGGNE